MMWRENWQNDNTPDTSGHTHRQVSVVNVDDDGDGGIVVRDRVRDGLCMMIEMLEMWMVLCKEWSGRKRKCH